MTDQTAVLDKQKEQTESGLRCTTGFLSVLSFFQPRHSVQCWSSSA